MAVKIVRQPNKIGLLGAPTSAAATSLGSEGAPASLRKAGLVERLRSIGYEVTDFGDDPAQTYRTDEESPRARNLTGVLAALETLKPRVEQVVKSGALPLIISGDCSVALATMAGVHRYFRNVGIVYMDRDADLNTPATTLSGSLDGMVVSHLTGRGAAELVRFWGEPPLVREPELALFGVDRLDPGEQEALRNSPLRQYLATDVQRIGAASAADAAVERIHGKRAAFVLHFDVDVIADFQATNHPGTGGLGRADVRESLEVFTQQQHLAAIEVTGYNPTKDPDGSGAGLIVDLLANALEKRLTVLQPAVSVSVEAAAGAETAPSTIEEASKRTERTSESNTAQGESWSSESIEETPHASETSERASTDPPETSQKESGS